MRIGIIGLGLIGGSLLRAFARHDFDVFGYDADSQVREIVATCGFDAPELDALWDADLLVLAIPAPRLPDFLPSLSGFRGIVTDVTSVKGPVSALMRQHCPGVRYVGGHPMAGKEVSGFAAADATLFDGRAWALCLEQEVSTAREVDDWTTVASLLCRIGSRVVPTTPTQHDDAVARVSHLPHLLAAALAGTANDPLALTLAAGSFTDATRVAASEPYLVSAMCHANAEAVERALDDCLAALQQARQRLAGPREDLAGWLTPATAVRRAWPGEAGAARTDALTRSKLLSIGQVGGWVEAVDPVEAQIFWRTRRDTMP